MTSQFEAETAVTTLAPGRWAGRVSPHWNIGANPNGGYLVAIALRALQSLAPEHPDPISVTTHFLRPGVPDADCEIAGGLIRSGRTLSTGRATLLQDGTPRIEVIAGFADLGDAGGAEADLTLAPPEMPPPDACPQRSGEEQGIDLPLLDRMDVRIHPDQAQAGAAGQAVVSGWVRFRDGDAADSLAAVVFTDAFPPSVFGISGGFGWVPTIELTVHVRRRPAPGWMIGRFQTDDLHEGRMIESGALWDSAGNLVAQSRQIGLVILKD